LCRKKDMSENTVWVLFDSVTQIQSKSLSQEQLQSAIFKMRKSDFARFHIWTTGWQNWQALSIFLNSDQKIFIKDIETAKKITEEKTRKAIKPEITKSITKSTTLIYSEEDYSQKYHREKESHFDADHLTWSNTEPPTNMKFTKIKFNSYSSRAARHKLKIEILLISEIGKTFRSYSKNISMTGTMLEDNIPFDYYGIVFDVVVVNRYADNPENSRVQLKAKAVGDGTTPRLQFDNPTSAQIKRLTLLLNEYIEKQKSQDKKSA
jgi:hypothetical protein